MNILVLDNYDSFTYNIVHSVQRFSEFKVDIFRNDKITLNQIKKYQKIILSPGPGIPENANILKPLIKHFIGKVPIFGICLGLQAIAEVLGATLLNTKKVHHGIATPTRIIKNDLLFNGLPNVIQTGRYHSWIVENKSLPSCLEVIAESFEGEIMALRHVQHNIKGVQFHPESILTPDGDKIIENWLFK